MTFASFDWNSDGQVLTVQQKQFYERNGYLVVQNVVPQYELDRYRRRFLDICAGKHVRPEFTIMRDISVTPDAKLQGERGITKLQDFNLDPVLFDYCQYPAVVDVVRDLIGFPHSNLVAMHSMLINKPPDAGKLTSRHPMHQDMQYFPFGPPEGIVCAWTAMEWVHRGNGCLVVVPGSHKGPLHVHEYPSWEGGVNKAYHGIQNYDPSMPRTHVVMQAGDTVFFHPLLIHGSGTNRTSGYRKAISCHYANGDLCQYGSMPSSTEDTSQEIVQMAKEIIARRGIDTENLEFDLADLWRLRARPIGENRANL